MQITLPWKQQAFHWREQKPLLQDALGVTLEFQKASRAVKKNNYTL